MLLIIRNRATARKVHPRRVPKPQLIKFFAPNLRRLMKQNVGQRLK